MSTQQEADEKRYDPANTTLKFVTRPNDIGLNDSSRRALMSCGHAVTPQSLTDYCRFLLDKGDCEFTCPAAVDGTTQTCEKEWPYTEVRKLALLTEEEQKFFEEALPRLAAAQYCEYKSFPKCPGCHTFVERRKLTNLAVRCTICTLREGHAYDFCWQCLKTWKGPARSDKCENEGCVNLSLKTLATCTTITLSKVKTREGSAVDCPMFRACPTCGVIIEHNTSACKMIACTQCKKEFCFLCLKLKAECLKTHLHFIACTVAERQTSIPSRVK